MATRPNHKHLLSTSAYIKAVDTSDVISHKSHNEARAKTHLKESSDEVGA